MDPNQALRMSHQSQPVGTKSPASARQGRPRSTKNRDNLIEPNEFFGGINDEMGSEADS